MGTDTGRVQANGCGSRIAIDMDLSELDQVAALCGDPIIPAGQGFTLNDLTARLQCGRSKTQRRIQALISQGVLREIGRRPGPGQARVYEMVPNPSQS